ncbi:OLC1v1023590C1 [Oldenlandia corymbosa var. corymbosa]|uniref:OLC1v1023590C1 n=1 Tax=Oldenlandia corymbosa var. corymbosa TaxID=529605 RepID=A0AAV1C3X9_OLDCO|nr:OLC1v1023590C1 [Oldenlandia corymbosa var. corymbosa]
MFMEKASKVKLQTSAFVVPNSNSATYIKDLFDAFSTHSKKPRLKRLAGERSKCKISSNSKFLPFDQQAELPVRGILKNPNKKVVAENISDTCLRDASKLNHCDTQHVNRHVTFSSKDDVLEPRKNTSPAVDFQSISNLFSNINIGFSAKGQTAETEKKLSTDEEETNKDRRRCARDKFAVQQVTEKQVSGIHHVSHASNFVLGQHDFSRANLFNATAPYGQVPPQSDSHNRVTLHDEMYTSSSGIPKISSAPYIPKLTIPVFNHSSGAYSCNQRWLDLSQDPYHKHDSDCSIDFSKAYPRPPAAYLSVSQSNLYRKPLFCSQEIGKNRSDHTLPCPRTPHLSPKELMQTICSIPEWTPRATGYGQTSTSEGFVGLPLNSLGEFISLDSGVKDGFNHIKSTSVVAGPSVSAVIHENVLHNPLINQRDLRSWDKMNLCKSQHRTGRIQDSSCMVDRCVLPSRISMIEQYGIEKRSNVIQGSDPCFSSVESVVDRMKVFHIACNHDQVEQPGGNRIRQLGNPDLLSLRVPRSTMRLMGKEFTIDGKDLEASEKKEVWTDKEVITENSGGNDTNTRFVVHPILGTLRETVTDLPKYKTSQASRSDPQTVVSESKNSSQFSDSHNKTRNQNGGTVSKEIQAYETHPCSPSSFASPNSYGSMLQESCSANIPLSKSSRFSICGPNLLPDSSQKVGRSCSIPEYKTTPLDGAHFPFKFPFPDLECGRNIHPAMSHNSFKGSPYFSGSRLKGTSVDYHRPSSPSSLRYPWAIPGTNYGADASILSRPDPFSLSTHSFNKNSFSSASLAHRPSFPVHSGLSKESRYAPRTDNHMKSKFRVRVPPHGKGSKRRQPPASKGSRKLPKIGKMKGQDDCSNAIAEVEAGNNVGDLQCSKQLEVPSSGLQDAGLTVHKDQIGESATNDFLKHAGPPRSGPIKLTAGAKYILKSCQKNDQANGETTNSSASVRASPSGS